MKKLLTLLVLGLFCFSYAGATAEAAQKRRVVRDRVGYCKAYARDMASRRAGAQQVLGGAAVGAATGAIIGAIVGGRHSVGRGAAIGGVTGVVGGGIAANSRWRSEYRYAYNVCMNRR